MAQIDKGTFAVGTSGSLKFWKHHLDMELNPSVEYFPLKNLSLGFRQNAGLLRTGGYKGTSLRSEAYSRYYLKLSKRTYLFGEAGFAYGFGWSEFNDNNWKTQNLYSIYGLGISWFATDRLAIEGRIHYAQPIETIPDLGRGYHGQIGLKYYFAR